MAAKLQGFSFYISSPTEIKVTPVQKTISNNFDYAADLVTLQRLDGESNASYKQRIMDVNVHPGGPTYDGTINNLSRAFGYSRNRAINISLKSTSSGSYIATNPRVDILANKVVLYSDWRPNGTETIDKEIRIYQPDDEGYFLEDLVSEINTSLCFSAYIYSGVRPNMTSTNLIRGTTDTVLFGDLVESGNKIELSANMIIQDSIIFNDPNIFQTEVTLTPSASGEYKVDYTNGFIYPYNLPSGNYDLSYHYAIFPMVVDYSLIKIYSMQDDNFKNELFQKVTLDSGEEQNGLLNNEGAEVIQQMFVETRFLWGK
jgi:hypothetical protein